MSTLYAKSVVVPMDNLNELSNVPPTVLGNTDVPFYQSNQLIKNILISEDIRFTSDHHLGRYKFQIAVIDYILNDSPIDKVL